MDAKGGSDGLIGLRRNEDQTLERSRDLGGGSDDRVDPVRGIVGADAHVRERAVRNGATFTVTVSICPGLASVTTTPLNNETPVVLAVY